jgi:hypothetical protein
MSDLAPYKLTSTGRKVALSLVPVICPPRFVHLADAIIDDFELSIAASPPLLRTGLAAGLAGYDLASLPRYRRRAHLLTGADAERYFASWEHGITPMQVQLARGLNQLISLSCYEMPEVMEAVGYRPAAWIDEVTKKRLTVFADDVKKQEAQIIAPDPLRPGFDIDRVRRTKERA